MSSSQEKLPKTTKIKIDKLANLAKDILPLAKWGFTESARFGGLPYEIPSFLDVGDFRLTKHPTVIYSSKLCRIKLTIAENEEDILYVYYGRLHAPNNEWRIMWQGENCSCWYSFYHYNLALKFLDGISPEQALNNFNTSNMKNRHAHAKVIADYYKETRKISSPESLTSIETDLRLHTQIWDHYGTRFFEVFDLNHPEIWDKYVGFLNELTRLRSPSYSVKLKIC